MCFVAGIMTAVEIHTIWIPLAALCIACGVALLRRYYLAVLILIGITGYVDSLVLIPTESEVAALADAQFYRGRVISGKETETSRSLIVRIDETGNTINDMVKCRKFDVAVIIPGFTPSIEETDDIEFKATFNPIVPLTDLPDEIDPAQFLRKKFVYASAIVPPADIIGVYPGRGLKHWFYSQRQRCTDLIYRSKLTASTKVFLNTIITGNSYDLSEDTRQTFSKAGLAHILALSGLHVGIIATIVFWALWPLTLLGFNNYKIIAVILLLWCFAFITGMPPSVARAVIMSTIFLTGRLLQLRSVPMNSLFLAALAILIFSPDSLYSIGFQLTFSAVLAILIFAKPLNPVSQRNRITYNIMSVVTVSVAAMLGTGFLSAIYFHNLPLYFLLSNVLTAILLPPLLAGGIVVMLFQYAGIDFILLNQCVDWIYHVIEWIAKFISGLPGSGLDGIYLPQWYILPYASILVSLKMWLQKRNAVNSLILSGCVSIVAILIMANPEVDRESALYIARNKQRTDVLIYKGDHRLFVVSTSPAERNAINDRIQLRYRDFMARRGITQISIDSILPYSRGIRIIPFYDKNIALINGDVSPVHKIGINYAVICKGFKQTVSDIITNMDTKNIILSYDVHPKRATAYKAECMQYGIPVIDMSCQPWSLTCDNCE